MAILKCDDFTVEIKALLEFDEGEYIVYYMTILFKGKSILNHKNLLKPKDINGFKAPKNSFLFFQHGGDFILPFFKKSLKTKKPIYTKSLEPGMIIMAHPKLEFPFIDKKAKAWRGSIFSKEREMFEYYEFRLDKDQVQYIFFFSEEYIMDNRFFGNNGFSYHIVAEKKEVESFIAEFEKEIAPLEARILINYKKSLKSSKI